MKVPFPSLAIESRVELRGVSHVLIAREEAGHVFRSSVDGSTRTLTAADLVKAFAADELALPPEPFLGLPKGVREMLRYALSELPPERQAEAIRRHAYVKAVDHLLEARRAGRARFGRTDGDYEKVARIVAILTRGKRPSGSSVRDWHRRWERSGQNPTALVSLTHKRGRKPAQHVAAILDIVIQSARNYHFKPNGCSVPALHTMIEGKIDAYNRANDTAHPVPTVPQLYYLLANKLGDAKDKFRLVTGNRAAQRKFARKVRRSSPKKLMDIVEIDHVLLDVIAVRERTGVPLETEENAPLLKKGIAGRVWATVAICKRSRVIVGWYLTLDPPSYVSVMRCLRHVMTPKPDLQLNGHTVPNPGWGKPRIVHIDNGKEFHSISLRVLAAMFRFEIRHMGRHRPWERGRIERLFRDVQREVAGTAPGRTFSNPVKRGDYDSEGMARLTMPVIGRRFEAWVAGVHHQEEHRSLQWQTPAEVWDELAPLGIDYPASAQDVDLLTRMVLVKPLRDVGIEHLGLFWHSEAFEAVLAKNGPGKKYVCLLDPQKLDDLVLIEETEEGPVRHRGDIDCPDLVEGLDLDMWKRVRNRGRERTPAGERLRRERLYLARTELLEEARIADLEGEKLVKPKQKFADRAALEEAARRRALLEPGPADRSEDGEDDNVNDDPGPSATPSRSVAERSSHYA